MFLCKNHIYLIVLILLIAVHTNANNLRQISNIENLSNNSIESLYQDHSGKLWIGTCDGLNIYNGRDITVYQPSNKSLSLSGNIIDKIIETRKGIIWVQTYYGLNMLDRRSNSIKYFNEFKQNLLMTKDRNNTLFIVQDDNFIQYYDEQINAFKKISFPGVTVKNLLDFVIDKDDRLWMIFKNGTILLFNITHTPDGIFFKETQHLNHSKSLQYSFYSGNDIIFIDADSKLYTMNLHNGSKVLHYNMKNLLQEKGEVSSIVRSNENFFIGFKTNGVQILSKSNEEQYYELTTLPIDCGVFSLLKDKNQDIVWIGTDGQGVYIYSNDLYSIQSTKLKDYIPRIGKPIRSIYKDKQNTLWIGTKGDGIIKIYDYQVTSNLSNSNIERITTSNSVLCDNSVYCTRKGSKGLLWIGTEYGLNYYSFKDKTMRRAELNHRGAPIIYIHDIYDQDSVLWIATVGQGIIKAHVNWRNNQPIFSETEKITINNGDIGSNYFFSLYAENDTIIWFANRGYGAFKVDTRTMKYERINFSNRENNKTLDEVFSITKDKEYLYFGTSSGLIKFKSKDDYKIIDNNYGFPNNTIHTTINDNSDGSFWISTNKGLINFHPEQETFRNYGSNDGLSIIEYSDGAGFHDEVNNIIYMGGVNGFVTVSKNRPFDNEYMPKLTFDKLSIYGREVNINDYIKDIEGDQILELKSNQNFITLGVNAIDFLNASNYSFMYRIEGTKDIWIDNGSSNSIPLTNMSYGKHKLYVKYTNRVVGKSSPEYAIIIHILPPWYLSQVAQIAYFLLFLVIIFLVIKYIKFRSDKKRRRFLRELEAQHKDELYESKLSFFTSIAHEFCTPLTLIYGPCNQILEKGENDPKVRNYAQVILRNAKRLNSLIQDLIEFRKIETDSKPPFVEELNITEIVNDVVFSFVEYANTRKAKFYKIVPNVLKWNSDRNYITTIVTNLLSNAFKYMSDEGTVEIEVRQEIDDLIIRISNTGKGIKEKDLNSIFDRHIILNNLENDESNRLWSRNGLGLAISNSMVKNLSGTIEVQSTLYEWTHFIITLPMIDRSMDQIRDNLPSEVTKQIDVLDEMLQNSIKLPKLTFDKSKQTMLVIDDEIDILWFISDIFSANYNVITLSSSIEVEALLKSLHPDIILCDVNMPKLDGIELTSIIKSNKTTAHIPLIIISADQGIEEQVKGIDAGAELYITKPFNVEYLKSSVERLIIRKSTLKEYFASPISAYEINDGELIHNEDKELISNIQAIINEHIDDKKLNADFIAKEINISTRNLYRKLSVLKCDSISDMIRNSRLYIAESLLIHTQKTIDEIIYSSGFSNRVSFYKSFAKKHNCTPSEYREKEIGRIEK